MRFEDYLPIGSVVLLNDAQKKIVIIGHMQVKHQADGQIATYDYVGVPYPEGYMGRSTGMLFNHDRIREVVFTGYTNKEREFFVSAIQKVIDQTSEKVS